MIVVQTALRKFLSPKARIKLSKPQKEIWWSGDPPACLSLSFSLLLPSYFRAHPFTAPPIRPRTKLFWQKMVKIIMGRITSTDAAHSSPQLVPELLTKDWI